MKLTSKDPGVVVWETRDTCWWALCKVPGCRWRSSHPGAEKAVSAMHRHLVTAHVSDAIDSRQEPNDLQGRDVDGQEDERER